MKAAFSFRLMLLLYLLVIGSVPLLAAMFVFFGQTTGYAENELKDYADQTNTRAAERIVQEIGQLESIYRNINTDYYLQHQFGSGTDGVPDTFDMMKRQTDRMISVQKLNDPYVTDVCFMLDTTFCSDTNLIPPQEEPGQPLGNERLLQPFHILDEGNSRYGLRLVAPLYRLDSNAIIGHLVVVTDISLMMNDFHGALSSARHTIKDAQGRTIYSYAAKGTTDTEGIQNGADPDAARKDEIVSVRTIDHGGIRLTSQLSVPNEYISSSWSSLSNTLIIFFGVVLLLSIISSFFFARVIANPLQSLRLLMKRAELGDLKAYWTSGGSQEMNDLGESYNQMLNRLEELIKKVKIEESLKKEAEITALQYQLNPHFLYNTLNTIKWVAKIHHTPQIADAVSALVRLLQASLGKKGDFLTIKEEIGLIQDYMNIQAFRYGDQVKTVFEIESVASLCLVPRLILQPLVENALIHGIEPRKGEGMITIRAYLDRDMLLCEVSDNGVGMKAKAAAITAEQSSDKPSEGRSDIRPINRADNRTAKEKMSGIGLQHIRDKIRLYYGDDYKMHIFSKENEGTTIRLSLPIHASEEL